MRLSKIPNHPEFALDDDVWVTKTELSPEQYKGYKGKNKNIVPITFAPDGRDEDPLTSSEIELVKWTTDKINEVHEIVIQKVLSEYPSIRNEYIDENKDYFDDELLQEIVPEVKNEQQLKKLISLNSINVHHISKDNIPFIGVELGCNWEEEHGMGILLHGTNLLEMGHSDKAFLLWVAEKYI